MHSQFTEDLRQDMDNKVDTNLIQKHETNGSVQAKSSPDGNSNDRMQLEFKIDECPPWHIIFLYSFQYLIATIRGPLIVIYLVHMNLCTEGRDANLLFAQLLSTAMVMVGVATFMQTTFGTRLPIVQCSASTFVVCVTAMMQTDTWKCPEMNSDGNISLLTNTTQNEAEPWIPRLNEINGCLLLASLVQVLFGLTGMVGLLLNFIGPLTLGVVISLVGLSLTDAISVSIGQQWGIAMMDAVLLALFSMVLGKFNIPIPTLDFKKGCKMTSIRIFKIYPFLFATSITWLFCFILTITNVFPSDPSERGYQARTDAKLDVIKTANWFYFPYPGQWGMPTITTAGVFIGMMSTTVSSTLESVGDYYAAARACQVSAPPKHAVNRGIVMEGFASILSALCGAAHPTTSYSSCIGYISLTGVASRIVLQVFAILIILLGIFGKFGAVLASIPSPIIGGSALVSLGMVTGMGISMLQFADLNSGRNIFLIGVSLMMGLMLPNWLRKNPGVINTGVYSLDQSITVFLSIGMCVGGVTAFMLDNILPGTKRERGLHIYEHSSPDNNKDDSNGTTTSEANADHVYDLPILGSCIKRFKAFSYIPCMPTYKDRKCSCCCKKKQQDNQNDIVF